MVYLISIATLLSTLCGGLFALRFKDKLHLVLGFSAGTMIGVVFFDLLPEAIALGSKQYDTTTILAIVALGFTAYMLLDRLFFFHSHEEETTSSADMDHHGTATIRGILGAVSLSLHSFLDGAAIGLAFQASNSVGVIVATAVLVHDFSDGINTVNLILKNKGSSKQAFKWLILDSIAPVLGVLSTLLFTLPESALGLVLAIFAGFFLYIGASDLLPESHHRHPTIWTSLSTVLGIAVLYTVIQLVRI